MNDGYKPLPTTLFVERADTYSWRHLRPNASRPDYSPVLVPAGAHGDLEAVILDIAEALMLSDGITLKLTGPNDTIAILARMFGGHEAAELIRKGIIQFTGHSNAPGYSLDPSKITYTDGTPVPPGNPLSIMIDYVGFAPSLFRDAKLDPEASAVFSLRKYRDELGLKDKEIRELSRRAVGQTHIIPRERVAEINARVGSAYSSGSLNSLGLSPEIARDKNEYQDRACFELIDKIAHTEMLLDLELDQYQMPETWPEIGRFATDATSGNAALRSVDGVLSLRGFPDLRSLFRDGVLKIGDIPELRRRQVVEDFRRWLWSKPDPGDAPAIMQDFVSDLSGQATRNIKSRMGRFVSIVGFSALQDASLNALGIPENVRLAVDAGLALLSVVATEKFKRRPPSAFLDEVIQPAVYAKRSA